MIPLKASNIASRTCALPQLHIDSDKMGPTKRARPSFSPPRPGKSKSGKAATSTTKKQKASTSTRKISNGSHKRKASRQDESDDEEPEESEDEEEDVRSRSKSKKSKGVRSFIMDEASGSEDEEEEPEEEEDLDDDDPEASTFLSRRRDSASPEPDMMLAEIEVSPSTQSPIPEALIHKMLVHHFTKKDIKMSRDARDLVSKYVEVFVREAIMRSVFERQEKEKGAGGGVFLEVEDLERAAVQLCLDF